MSETFGFMALGQAIKKAREAKGMTREQLAEILDVAPRHIQSIENEGQYPSFPLFIRLVTMFNISVDQYIFSDKRTEKTTLCLMMAILPLMISSVASIAVSFSSMV